MTCCLCQKPIHPGERFDESPLGPITHERCLPVVTLQEHFTIPVPAVEVRKPRRRYREYDWAYRPSVAA